MQHNIEVIREVSEDGRTHTHTVRVHYMKPGEDEYTPEEHDVITEQFARQIVTAIPKTKKFMVDKGEHDWFDPYVESLEIVETGVAKVVEKRPNLD